MRQKLASFRALLHACGVRTSQVIPGCLRRTSDMALNYTCACYIISPLKDWAFILDNGEDTDQLFFPKCGTEKSVDAVPFTNKGFYICLGRKFTASAESCPLHHIWNDKHKECEIENI